MRESNETASQVLIGVSLALIVATRADNHAVSTLLQVFASRPASDRDAKACGLLACAPDCGRGRNHCDFMRCTPAAATSIDLAHSSMMSSIIYLYHCMT